MRSTEAALLSYVISDARRGEFEKQKTTTVGGPSTAPDLALVVLQQLKVIFYKALEQRP